MTHTVDSLMALHDEVVGRSKLTEEGEAEARSRFLAALTEVFDQLDIQAGSIEAVQAANQRLAQASQPNIQNYPEKDIPQTVGINGLTEAETNASMSVMGLSKPKAAQPVREPQFMEEVAYEHVFSDGSKVLSYALSSAGFPPRTDATQVNLLYYSVDGIGGGE